MPPSSPRNSRPTSRHPSLLEPILLNLNTTPHHITDRASTHSSSRQRQPRIPIWPRLASHNNSYISSSSFNSIISSSKCNNLTTRVMRRRLRASSCSKCPTTFRSGKILGWRKRGSWGRRSLPRSSSWWIRGLAKGSCHGRSIMSWVLKGSTRVAFRQIYSIIDSCLVMPEHVPIKCPHLAVCLHEV